MDSPDALAVGEDFVMLSSAKFEPNRIEVTERIGLDLVLPLAAMLPFERHIKWVEQKQIGCEGGRGVAGRCRSSGCRVDRQGQVCRPQGRLRGVDRSRVVNAAMTAASKLGGDQLRKMNSEALAKQDYMAAVLTRFGLDLDDGEEKRVLLRSRR